MNIKSLGSPEFPNWMKRFRPTDIKWLNEERTAALCVLNDQRYRLKLIWTEDGSPEKTNCEEVDSTQNTDLEKLEKIWDDLRPLEKPGNSPAAVIDQVRQQLIA